MKVQHEQLVMLEERCRKMKLLIRDKKKEKAKIKGELEGANQKTGQVYTQEELDRL